MHMWVRTRGVPAPVKKMPRASSGDVHHVGHMARLAIHGRFRVWGLGFWTLGFGKSHGRVYGTSMFEGAPIIKIQDHMAHFNPGNLQSISGDTKPRTEFHLLRSDGQRSRERMHHTGNPALRSPEGALLKGVSFNRESFAFDPAG